MAKIKVLTRGDIIIMLIGGRVVTVLTKRDNFFEKGEILAF